MMTPTLERIQPGGLLVDSGGNTWRCGWDGEFRREKTQFIDLRAWLDRILDSSGTTRTEKDAAKWAAMFQWSKKFDQARMDEIQILEVKKIKDGVQRISDDFGRSHGGDDENTTIQSA